jgi:hypothetical protein
MLSTVAFARDRTRWGVAMARTDRPGRCATRRPSLDGLRSTPGAAIALTVALPRASSDATPLFRLERQCSQVAATAFDLGFGLIHCVKYYQASETSVSAIIRLQFT